MLNSLVVKITISVLVAMQLYNRYELRLDAILDIFTEIILTELPDAMLNMSCLTVSTSMVEKCLDWFITI